MSLKVIFDRELNAKKKHPDFPCGCGNEVYETREHIGYGDYDDVGKPIKDGPTFIDVEVYCPKCGKTVYLEEIEEENAKRHDDAIRKFHNLISHEDTLKLPKKYGVPREWLEEILGLQGELILRTGVIGNSMWEDFAPSKRDSEIMKKALSSPTYFLERLDAAKDKLPKQFYEKVRKRIVVMTEKEN